MPTAQPLPAAPAAVANSASPDSVYAQGLALRKQVMGEDFVAAPRSGLKDPQPDYGGDVDSLGQAARAQRPCARRAEQWRHSSRNSRGIAPCGGVLWRACSRGCVSVCQ